jgi:YVTN family beta-propeller protein
VGFVPLTLGDVTPDGASVYVPNLASNSVSVIDTTTNTVVATVPVGVGPAAIDINPSGTFAYTANAGGGVSVISTAINAVVATVSVGPSPQGVAVSPNGTFAYVANSLGNTVSVIDTATNTVTGTITVGTAPIFIAFTPDPVAALIAQLQELIDSGSLSEKEGAALTHRLKQILAKLANHQTNAACNQLGAFSNHVQAFIKNGMLTQAQGQALINGANNIMINLGC